METLNIPIAAGETKTFAIAGNYIEVLESNGLLDIVLYSQQGAQKFARGAEQGAWMKEPFTNFTLKSTIAQTVKMIVTGWEAGSRRQSGAVAVTNVNGAFSHDQVNVTNAAGGVSLRAANADRRYLLIQNRDAVGNLYVRLDGAVPTAANGIKVEPGGSLELASFVPTGEVRAIADVAAASAIVVEG